MTDIKVDIAEALAIKFPQFGAVEPTNIIPIMEGKRFAYQIITNSGQEIFIKSIPESTQHAAQENMRIQKELADAGVPVPTPLGIMNVGAHTFIVEEFSTGKMVRLPQARHLTQVAKALAKQHIATEIAPNADIPELKAYAKISALEKNFQQVFSRFEEEGIPQERWQEALTDYFVEQFQKHNLACYVAGRSDFGDDSFSPEENFRQVASEISRLIIEDRVLDYITGVFDELRTKHEAYAPFLHRSRLHEDPNNENMLFDDAGKLQVMIDYEYSQLGQSYMDLATAINTQFRHYKDSRIDWDAANQMVSAYHQVRPLSAQEVELLPTAIHARSALITALSLTEFSKILDEKPPRHFKNPIPNLNNLMRQREELDGIARDNILYPKDALQQKVLQTFFPYLNTRRFRQLESYENPLVAELLDGVETFLKKEKIAIPYDETLPPKEIPDNFNSVVGLATFRLNKAPELHNQPPLSHYYVNNMQFQRNLANLMFALANYCEQEKTGIPTNMKDEDIFPEIGLNRISSSDPNGFEKVSQKEYPDFSKPVIFALGGLGTQEGSDAGIIQNNLEKIPLLLGEQDIDQYLVTYPSKPMVLYCAYGSQYNQDPEHYYSEAAMQFTQDLLLSAVSPNYTPIHRHAQRFRAEFAQDPVVEGERYVDIEEVKGRLGNIRFVAHSYGTCFVQEVRNALTRSMNDLGYSREEIQAVLPAVFSLNTGVLVQTDIAKKEGDFSQFNMVLDADVVANNCADHNRQSEVRANGADYTLTSPHANAVNYRNHVMQGEFHITQNDSTSVMKQRSAHEWEFYLHDGYDKSGVYHNNSELPAGILKAAIERGPAIAGDLKTLFTAEIHDAQSFSAGAGNKKQAAAAFAR